jgi:hypothetical protein
MKAHRKKLPSGHSFVFKHQRPKNVLCVRLNDAGVVIPAKRDNFSDRDKAFFVRHLAAEGFIDDEFKPLAECNEAEPEIRWKVQKPRVCVDAQGRARTFMFRLLVGASLLWLVELIFLLIRL